MLDCYLNDHLNFVQKDLRYSLLQIEWWWSINFWMITLIKRTYLSVAYENLELSQEDRSNNWWKILLVLIDKTVQCDSRVMNVHQNISILLDDSNAEVKVNCPRDSKWLKMFDWIQIDCLNDSFLPLDDDHFLDWRQDSVKKFCNRMNELSEYKFDGWKFTLSDPLFLNWNYTNYW